MTELGGAAANSRVGKPRCLALLGAAYPAWRHRGHRGHRGQRAPSKRHDTITGQSQRAPLARRRTLSARRPPGCCGYHSVTVINYAGKNNFENAWLAWLSLE